MLPVDLCKKCYRKFFRRKMIPGRDLDLHKGMKRARNDKHLSKYK